MTDASPGLYLVTPLVTDPDAIASALNEACATARIAAVLLRLGPADERGAINHVKALAPLVQRHGAALVVAGGGAVDLAAVAARGGADGLHLPASAEMRSWRERLQDDRILGAGEIRSKHDAMNAGEAGADYVMFGEPRPDGFVPALEGVVERAQWWSEIFATPCVAFAPDLEAVGPLAASGAEFVALGDAVWDHPAGAGAAVEEAHRLIASVVPA